MNQAERTKAVLGICDAIVEAVAATPDGAPGGTLYAALMSHGCAIEQFETIMGSLVAAGRLRKKGHLYFASASSSTSVATPAKETVVHPTAGSVLPWYRLGRAWEYKSPDGKTYLRVSPVGMKDERSHYVYRDNKCLGCRKDLEEAKILAESGKSEMMPAASPLSDLLDIPEELRMTAEKRKAARDATPLTQVRPVVPAKPAIETKPVVKTKRSKISMDAVIVVPDKNPRKAGSKGYDHYERMRGSITVAQYIAKHKTDKDKRNAKQWLDNTLREKHVSLKDRR